MINIAKESKDLIKILSEIDFNYENDLNLIGNLIAEKFRNGFKLLICGNGGSAADSQHFAAEFVSSFSRNRRRVALPAISLTTDTSFITAYSNDFDFNDIFVRQIEALGRPGDLLVVFSTSGESQNCINATNFARNIGMSTIAFTSKDSTLASISELSLRIPSTNTQRIQEMHLFSFHIVCEIVESLLFDGEA